MPRELVLLSSEMPGDAVFREAVLAVADGGVPVSLDLDAAGLLARFHSDEFDPVLTVLHPRRVPGIDEVSRILPGLAPLPSATDATWWSDVVVPWGAAQALGQRLAEAVALALGGRLIDLTLLPRE